MQSYEELDVTECLAGARQCATEVLGQGILPTAERGIRYDYTHFTDEETKAEKLNSVDHDQVARG